jgi:hypothetical protein
MKRTILFLLLLTIPSHLYAQGQEAPPRAQTSAPDTARFEIVRLPIMGMWTFRLDKYTGGVWRIVKTRNGDLAWEGMPVVNLPRAGIDMKVRYQIFASGLVGRDTFLLNIETGQTWVLTSFKEESKEIVFRWEPLAP